MYCIVWKKVEEYLRLFETSGGIWFSLFPVCLLRKLVLFSGQTSLHMKLTAKKANSPLLDDAKQNSVRSIVLEL